MTIQLHNAYLLVPHNMEKEYCKSLQEIRIVKLYVMALNMIKVCDTNNDMFLDWIELCKTVTIKAETCAKNLSLYYSYSILEFKHNICTDFNSFTMSLIKVYLFHGLNASQVWSIVDIQMTIAIQLQ